MKSKNIFAVMLLGAMCVGFVACENDEPEVNNNGSSGGITTPTYTVKLTVKDEAMGTVTGSGVYEEGDTITLTATANEGYKFVKWSDDSIENPRTIVVTADVTLTANFVLREGYSIENGYFAVDLGLPSGLLWATCNVGAENPEEYGDYFAWGETTPKKDESGNYILYDWSTYKWWSDENNSDWGFIGELLKYVSRYALGRVDGKTVLEPEDDAAAVNWGGDWRMPTFDEQKELLKNCTWTWTANYNGTGKKGYIVASKAEGNSNYIFLPAAGVHYISSLNYAGTNGFFWSSSLYFDPDNAHILSFELINEDLDDIDRIPCKGERFAGISVRAVCEK